jgi:hypothetical protein
MVLGEDQNPVQQLAGRVAIVDQEPQRAEAVTYVHGEAAGLLDRPCPGGVGGHLGRVGPPGAVLDEHQTYKRLSSTVSPPGSRRR